MSAYTGPDEMDDAMDEAMVKVGRRVMKAGYASKAAFASVSLSAIGYEVEHIIQERQGQAEMAVMAQRMVQGPSPAERDMIEASNRDALQRASAGVPPTQDTMTCALCGCLVPTSLLPRHREWHETNIGDR